MKALVVYDSNFGNTKKIAEVIAKTIPAKAINVSEFKKSQLEGITLLVVGSPIQGWRPSPATLTFLSSLKPGNLTGIKIAAFDTRIKIFFSGSASDKINKQLITLGGKSIIPPANFIVKGKEGPLIEGELEKAENWARQIADLL